MRIVWLVLIAVCCSSLMAGVRKIAPDGKRVCSFEENRLPEQGREVKEFVPPGWRIEKSIAGSIFGSKGKDAALVLIEDRPERNEEGNFQNRNRALVLLKSAGEANFVRHTVACRALMCTDCVGMMGSSDIQLEKDVLVLSWFNGSRSGSRATARFRYDRKLDQVVLIGLDESNWQSAIHPKEAYNHSSSKNFLTGRAIVDGKESSIARTLTPIEDYDSYEENKDSR